MQKDFHFYCIGVLARVAGFSPEEAITIAYSSEYVDGATENEPIKVGKLIFDPVRTAHNGLKAFDWGVQKKVYFPFHFIPPKPVQTGDDTYVTKPASEFALQVFRAAAAEKEQDLRLYRMGVALHTFADTFSHEGFSGIEEKVNDVEAIHVFKNGRWENLFIENIFLDILPHIGHGQAGNYPDMSHLTWRYQMGTNNQIIEHNNSDKFLNAAEKIYNLLLGQKLAGAQPMASWNDIQPRIKTLVKSEADIEVKCHSWKAAFGYLFENSGAVYDYDNKAWREDALESPDVDWDDDKPADFRKRKYNMGSGFATKPWVMFHRAAEKQRHFVMEQML